MTNKPLRFQTTTVIEARLSGFHEMIVAVMKMYFRETKPRVINYQKCRTFNNDGFANNLGKELTKQKKVLERKGLTRSQKFVNIFLINTPLKKTTVFKVKP